MSIEPGQADTGLCIGCKAINFDDIFSGNCMRGAQIGDWRVVCPLPHIDGTSSGSCPLCDFLRTFRPTYPISGHLSLRVKWAKTEIDYREQLVGNDEDLKKAFRIEPHDPVLLFIYGVPKNTTGPYRPDTLDEPRQFMELNTAESKSTITARRVDDQVNFNLVRSWLEFCREHHRDRCYEGLDGIRDIPGFSVIDCASRQITLWAEIPEGHDRSYTALSYLWGTDTSIATQDGMIPSPSPKVIEDAVTATVELGFKYLWVDRYCIPQHNPKLKSAQIKRMDDVYGSSAVTIVAAAGDGPAYGLPGVSSTPRVPQKSVRVGPRTLIAINNDICDRIRSSKWNTRAWTLQEGTLSARCLCFEDDQVYFQCNHMHRFESIIPLEPPKTNPYVFGNGWGGFKGGRVTNGISNGSDVVHALEEYIPRQISYPSDGLQAFQGILRKAARLGNPIYNVWGALIRVYQDVSMTASLIMGLCWRLDLGALRGTDLTNTWEIPYPSQLRRRLFPSWSWVDWVQDFIEKCIDIRQAEGISLAWLYKARPLTQGISMEYMNRTTVPWESRYQDILFPGMSNEAPRILRIRGYTCDALLRRFSKVDSAETKGPPSSSLSHSSLQELSDFWLDDGWIWSDRDCSYCNLLLTWPAGIKFDYRDFNNADLCLVADWIKTDTGPSSASPLRGEYSFRVILLCREFNNLVFMVLTPVDRGEGYPDAYERVNIISRRTPPVLSSETSLEGLGPEFLRGWTMEETIIV